MSTLEKESYHNHTCAGPVFSEAQDHSGLADVALLNVAPPFADMACAWSAAADALEATALWVGPLERTRNLCF